MRVKFFDKAKSMPILAIIAAIILTIGVAVGGNVQTAHADLQGVGIQADAFNTQAAAKKLTTKNTYTFCGVYEGTASITSKAVKGSSYKCTKGTLKVKNIQVGYKGKTWNSWKKMAGRSFKVAVAKNCKFYSYGSSGATRLKAKEGIKRIKNGQAISLQIVVSDKKAKKIYFGAW